MSNVNTELVEPACQSPVMQDQVYLGDVLGKIVELVGRYSYLPHPSLAVLIACWIANTYTYEHFRYCGYLALRSAMPRSGKTRLLDLIGQLSNGSPRPTVLPTPAVLYRGKRKVLLLDEVDRLKNSDRETHGAIIGILNAGFQAGGTIERVNKTQKEGFTVETFLVYGPKAFAGIESLTDTLTDRCFTIQMTRHSQRMPRLNFRLMAPECEAIQASLQTWADQNGEKIAQAYQDLPNTVPGLHGFDDRLQDIAEPLFILADLADREREEEPLVTPRLLQALKEVAASREPSSRELGLSDFLEIAKRYLGPEGDEVFIPSIELRNECELTDGLGWISSAIKLAGFLKHFDLSPRQSPDGTYRGYLIRREWVQKWERNLSNDPQVA